MMTRANAGLGMEGTKAIQVLVVDDSAFMRFTISKYLNEAEGIRVVGTARNGQEALELIPKLNPDVVTLDVEMPVMDGLSALRVIMSQFPRPVIMLSSLTAEGALETIQALTAGAVDFVAKPENRANVSQVMADVVTKIHGAVHARLPRIISPAAPRPAAQVLTDKVTRPLGRTDPIVVIGASTGGPRALSELVPHLPASLKAAYLIIQHMPVGFTRSMAQRLDELSQISVREACPGDQLMVGQALVAPGGFHMVLDAAGSISLNQNPPIHGVRPAVDVTMSLVARYFGERAISVILTGMGSDGTTGATLVHEAGGHVIAEAESSCVVWGMPRSVVEAGAADEILPLSQIAAAIEKAVMKINLPS